MPFVKQRNGLLEDQDFYLTSSFADFLISGEASRKDGVFELRKGEIKRHFTYTTFVIEVEKVYLPLAEKNQQIFFIETNQRRLGLYDASGVGYCAYWRLICHEGFVEAYKSGDGLAWEIVGGEHLAPDERILYQGFEVVGDQALSFSRYRVFHDPFLTLQNFPEGFKAECYDTEGSLFKAAFFDHDMTARLFWEAQPTSGSIQVKDALDNLIYEAPRLEYIMGERYIYTAYLLEMRYEGEIIGYGPTQLDEKSIQRMVLCNLSLDETYRDILLAVEATGDQVELSLDGSHYTPEITIATLAPKEECAFYVRITKESHDEFEVREFDIILK